MTLTQALQVLEMIGPWKKLFLAVYKQTGSKEDALKAVRWAMKHSNEIALSGAVRYDL